MEYIISGMNLSETAIERENRSVIIINWMKDDISQDHCSRSQAMLPKRTFTILLFFAFIYPIVGEISPESISNSHNIEKISRLVGISAGSDTVQIPNPEVSIGISNDDQQQQHGDETSGSTSMPGFNPENPSQEWSESVEDISAEMQEETDKSVESPTRMSSFL